MGRRSLHVLAVLFVCTGAGGLLSEQVFEKLLTSLVGASTPAGAIVLAVYFGGLTLGAALFSRLKVTRPLRLYALVELGVAAWALLLLLGADQLGSWLVPLLRLGVNRFWLLQLLRAVAACVWILPPTVLMGLSFPAVVAALDGWKVDSPRRLMAGFYGLNLLGALAGALLGPAFLFPQLGLHGTLVVTVVLDGVAGLAALWLARRDAPMTSSPSEEIGGAITAGRSLLVLAFGSGFLFFALEVLWTHLIGTALGNSVYAFAATLAVVMTGLLLGGFAASRRWPEARAPGAGAIGALLLAGAWSLLLQLTLWPRVPNFFIEVARWADRRGAPLTTFAEGETVRWLVAAALLLPPAAILGMVYPLLFRLGEFPERDRARLAARMGAWNSVGCVLGALGCGFALIPSFGSESTLRAIIMALGASALLLGAAWLTGKDRVTIAVTAAMVMLFALLMPSWNRLDLTSGGHVYFDTGYVSRDSTLEFFHEDTLGGITTVVGTRGEDGVTMRTLLTNGKFQANDSDESRAQVGFAVVPMMHLAHFDDALVIGLGSGHSAAQVVRAGFGHVEIAELSPGIVAAARAQFAGLNEHVLDAPQVTLRLEDGRNHLTLTDQQYDLITMEISSVWFAGSSSLYSTEFYRLARAHLKPGGVMQQWIQVHHIGLEELTAALRTMRSAFPVVSFWVVGGQGILVGSEGAQVPVPEALARLLQRAGWSTGSAPEEQLTKLLASRLLAPGDVDRLLAAQRGPLNTDSNRYLEYATPRYNLDRRPLDVINLSALSRFATWPQWDTRAWPSRLGEQVNALTVADYRAALQLEE